MGNLTTREEAALRDPDVKFGYDNYEMLKQVGELVQQMRAETSMSQAALHAASGVDQGDISRLESGALERGPTLLTLVKLAHAAGKRLVIGIEDAERSSDQTTSLLHF
jgi:transcriptional regulator with XRE-family HTH domain